jgi:hypothetical protein
MLNMLKQLVCWLFHLKTFLYFLFILIDYVFEIIFLKHCKWFLYLINSYFLFNPNLFLIEPNLLFSVRLGIIFSNSLVKFIFLILCSLFNKFFPCAEVIQLVNRCLIGFVKSYFNCNLIIN